MYKVEAALTPALRDLSPTQGKSGHTEPWGLLEAAGRISSTGKKQRKINFVQLTSSFSPESYPRALCPSQWVGLPTSGTPNKAVPYRLALKTICPYLF